MRGLFALYAKDVRELRTTLAVLCGTTAFLYAYVVLAVESEGAALFLSVFPIWTTLLILPFVLVHAFTVEWRASSHHLMLALPVPRWALAASKCAAVLTAGAAVTAIAASGIAAISADMPVASQLFAQMGTTPKRLMAFACGQYLSFLVLFVGVAMGATGVRYATHRGRGFAVAGFLLTALYLFLNTLFTFVQAVGGRMGLAWTTVLYPVSFGAAFLLLGLILYDRRAEI